MSAAGLVRTISIFLTIVVVLSYGMFVWDELGTASKGQSDLASSSEQVIGVKRDAHGRIENPNESSIRVHIDQVNDVVTSPGESFGKSISKSHNEWALRTSAFLFGILVFTFGLGYLSRWLETSGSTKLPTRDPNAGFTAGSR